MGIDFIGRQIGRVAKSVKLVQNIAHDFLERKPGRLGKNTSDFCLSEDLAAMGLGSSLAASGLIEADPPLAASGTRISANPRAPSGLTLSAKILSSSEKSTVN